MIHCISDLYKRANFHRSRLDKGTYVKQRWLVPLTIHISVLAGPTERRTNTHDGSKTRCYARMCLFRVLLTYWGIEGCRIPLDFPPEGTCKPKLKCWITSERWENDKNTSIYHLNKNGVANRMVTSFPVCQVPGDRNHFRSHFGMSWNLQKLANGSR